MLVLLSKFGKGFRLLFISGSEYLRILPGFQIILTTINNPKTLQVCWNIDKSQINCWRCEYGMGWLYRIYDHTRRSRMIKSRRDDLALYQHGKTISHIYGLQLKHGRRYRLSSELVVIREDWEMVCHFGSPQTPILQKPIGPLRLRQIRPLVTDILGMFYFAWVGN